MKVKIISATENLEQVISMAAKLCYSAVGVDEIKENLTSENVEKFLNMLMSLGHESPLEHASFTFAVEGISRTCSHQLVRHRLASYSQQSQRYVKLAQFEYIIPPAIKGNKRAEAIFIEAMEKDQKAYNLLSDSLLVDYIFKNYRDELVDVVKQHSRELGLTVEESDIFKAIDNMCDIFTNVTDVEKAYNAEYLGLDVMGYISLFAREYKGLYSKAEKIAIEDARYVFPNACETKLVFTMNTRTLYNFLGLRSCERAQWEVRELAIAMLKELRQLSPILFKNVGPGCVTSKCTEGKMSCGRPKEIKEKFSKL